MQASAYIPTLPKLIFVDFKGIQSHRCSPGALTTKQFDVYVESLAKGIGGEQAKRLAAESPRR